ncbi:SEPT2 [Acanthosepion pharaonis]|uniref:SEPT2 n=1 Tax=Acanthosepion pharaonis TaxID=158019 RepID=A0A812B4N7_ACAPH|nr:SEPT2 [Sepia pharaonis]
MDSLPSLSLLSFTLYVLSFFPFTHSVFVFTLPSLSLHCVYLFLPSFSGTLCVCVFSLSFLLPCVYVSVYFFLFNLIHFLFLSIYLFLSLSLSFSLSLIHTFVNPEQIGYVGFANLPNQVHRKSVKKGFEFTLLVVGESGLGKSTLVNSLFLADLYPERHIPSASEKISQTVKIDASTVEIEERGVKLRLTVVDTPGFGDSLNSEDCFFFFLYFLLSPLFPFFCLSFSFLLSVFFLSFVCLFPFFCLSFSFLLSVFFLSFVCLFPFFCLSFSFLLSVFFLSFVCLFSFLFFVCLFPFFLSVFFPFFCLSFFFLSVFFSFLLSVFFLFFVCLFPFFFVCFFFLFFLSFLSFLSFSFLLSVFSFLLSVFSFLFVCLFPFFCLSFFPFFLSVFFPFFLSVFFLSFCLSFSFSFVCLFFFLLSVFFLFCLSFFPFFCLSFSFLLSVFFLSFVCLFLSFFCLSFFSFFCLSFPFFFVCLFPFFCLSFFLSFVCLFPFFCLSFPFFFVFFFLSFVCLFPFFCLSFSFLLSVFFLSFVCLFPFFCLSFLLFFFLFFSSFFFSFLLFFDHFKPIIQYIDEQFERYLHDESGLNRRHIIDNRVHCCFYFINPSSHGLKPLDISFMILNLPWLQKCVIMDQIDEFGINIYPLPDCDSDEDDEYKEQCRQLKEAVPFAVVGSSESFEVNGRKVRGRRYPWGVVEVENPDHCDFIKLRTMLITHMQDLQEVTQEIHYENFRAEKLAGGKVVKQRSSRSGIPQPDINDREQALAEKEAELRKMKEITADNTRNWNGAE